jgi:hypothetical protein
MMKWLSTRAVALGAAMVFSGFALAPVSAQRPYDNGRRGNDWDWDGNYTRLTRINPGTFVTVRTSQTIASDRTDGRIFNGVVADDVWDEYGRLAVPAIPRGSRVTMMVRTARDGDLVLDLDSINAHGQWYAVNAAPERIESGNQRHNDNPAAYAGGGAILGTIIGAIAGGGKGAAIGAAAGAATGLGVAYAGRSIRVPPGSLLTFRLEEGLVMRSSVRGTSGGYPPPQYRNR